MNNQLTASHMVTGVLSDPVQMSSVSTDKMSHFDLGTIVLEDVTL